MKNLPNSIPLSNCNLLGSASNLDPIYKYCLHNKIKTVNQLLSNFDKGSIVIRNKDSKTQLEGLIDLIQFRYAGKIKEEIISILNKTISYTHLELGYFTPQEEYLFRRLGFYTAEINAFLKVVSENQFQNSLIHLMNTDFFPLENSLNLIINTKIVLLNEMYFLYLQKKKKKKTDILKDARMDDFGKIRLENTDLFYPNSSLNSLYDICIRNGIYTIEDFLQNFQNLYNKIPLQKDKLYLQGFYDLILFKYFQIKSKKVLSLLNQSIIIHPNITLNKRIKEIFIRCGFSEGHLPLIQEQLSFLKDDSCIRIIDFLRMVYDKNQEILYKLGSLQTTYYHIISLLLSYFTFEEEKLSKIAYLQKTLESVRKRAANLSNQSINKENIKLKKENKS